MENRVIMSRAHALTRAALAEFADADYRATFRAALRIAWEESRAVNPRAEWERMSGEEQYSALIRAVWYGVNRDRAECDRMGNYRPNYFEWIASEDDARACAHGAYIRMEDALTRAEQSVIDGKRDTLPALRAVMVSACRNSARATWRNEIKHNNATKRVNAKDYNDTNGTNYMEIDEFGRNRRLTIIDESRGATAEHIAPNPENAIIMRDSIERACADDIDALIVHALADGYSMRAIGERIGMTHPAISKRIKRIRERYTTDECTTRGYGMAYAPAN